MMKIHNHLLVLALICNVAKADSSIFDDRASAPVFVVKAASSIDTNVLDVEKCAAVARTNIRVLDPTAVPTAESDTPINLQGVSIPSFSLDNIRNLLNMLSKATWQAGASFTSGALHHQLDKMLPGEASAARTAAKNAFVAFIHTPIGDNESYTEWATRLSAELGQEYGFIGANVAKGISYASVVTTMTDFFKSEENIQSLVEKALSYSGHPVLNFFAPEIAEAAAKLGMQAPGYVTWLADDSIDIDETTTSSTVTGIAVDASSLTDEELAAVPTAKAVSTEPSIVEEADKQTRWSKIKTSAGKIARKFSYSVKVGAQRAIQYVRENATWDNAKQFVTRKIERATGFKFGTKAAA